MAKANEVPSVADHKELFMQQLVTVRDLTEFKSALLIELKHFLELHLPHTGKKWLKSYEVEKLLGVSSNTLLTWRNNGTLPYTPLGGIYYYDPEDIEKVMQLKKKGRVNNTGEET